MKKIIYLLTVMPVILISACKESVQLPEPKSFVFDFEQHEDGWIAGFADYPVGEEDFYELSFEYSHLPEPLSAQGALKISGNNHSDDLFMFVKKKVTGLKPNTLYEVKIKVELASNVPDGTFGVGGSPGEGVYVKVGASQTEPQKIIGDDNHYRMNIDKGNQSQSGENMVTVGNFANGTSKEEYVLITRQNTDQKLKVQSNAQGEAWVIVGTDSGFEATSTVYYNRITIDFR